MGKVKGTSRRVWLTVDDLDTLRRISEKTRLGQTELLSQITSAGLASITANKDTFQLPLAFKIPK